LLPLPPRIQLQSITISATTAVRSSRLSQQCERAGNFRHRPSASPKGQTSLLRLSFRLRLVPQRRRVERASR
jgi:hypothetical protein